MAQRITTILAMALAMVLVLSGIALAHNPPGDPLPVNGEPDCFGARVSHSASEHGLTPDAKVAATLGVLELLEVPEVDPPWEDVYKAYWSQNGVSVRTVQNWIRVNCSHDPYIANP